MTPTEQEGGKQMTNYNERRDEILSNFRQSSLIINANNSLGAGEKGRDAFIQSLDEAKQAITSLIKELVADARIDPFDFVEPCEPDCDNVRHAYHQGQWDMATRIKAQQEEV